MTKAELIRKIVKQSGIPDSEAKVFFEIFLQKTAGRLKPGLAVKLNNFGYFWLKLAVLNTTALKPSGKINQIDTEMIVFSTLDESEDEGLIFNIPSAVTSKYNYLDSFFSLSIGKPIIPLHGTKDIDYFILPTGYEMKKLIESKVDKLLDDVEIIENYDKKNEILVLKKNTSKDEQNNSNRNLSSLNTDSSVQTNKEQSSLLQSEFVDENSYNNIAWDFGENLSRQIEEEAIIDASLEQSQILSNDEPENESSLEWEFGEQSLEKTAVNFEQEVVRDENENIRPEENSKLDFQRVKAITSEYNFDESHQGTINFEDKLAWNFGENEYNVINGHKFEHGSVNIEKFKHPGESDIENTIDAISETKLENNQNINSGMLIKETSVIPSKNETGTTPKSALDRTMTREYHFSGKKSLVPFLIALFTIIGVGATLYIYINKISLYDFSTGKFLRPSNQFVKSIVPAVIERNYNVPVTYPYPKNLKQKVFIEENILKPVPDNKKNADTKPEASKNNSVNASNVLKKNNIIKSDLHTLPVNKVTKISNVNGNIKKIKDNIFQQSGNYIVQVSSWRSRSIADHEAAVYKAKGYMPYIEQADIPGRGTWFRVKIGDFKSISEAEKFSEQNK
ncbi:MAG: SPOR domain-containing protein [Ignavibacteriaceae bacterium]|jgi:hypothetical protein